jgi:hypothetical protein
MLRKELRCPDCQTDDIDFVAHAMSYFLRCRACGQPIIVTGLRNILDADSDRIIEARLDPRVADQADAAATIETLWGLPAQEVLTGC